LAERISDAETTPLRLKCGRHITAGALTNPQ